MMGETMFFQEGDVQSVVVTSGVMGRVGDAVTLRYKQGGMHVSVDVSVKIPAPMASLTPEDCMSLAHQLERAAVACGYGR